MTVRTDIFLYTEKLSWVLLGGGSCPPGTCSYGYLFTGNLSGGQLSTQELVRGAVVPPGICPYGYLSRGMLSGGMLSGGMLSRGILSASRSRIGPEKVPILPESPFFPLLQHNSTQSPDGKILEGKH